MSSHEATRERSAPRRIHASQQAENDADRAADRAQLGEPLGFALTGTRGDYATPVDGDVPAGTGQPLEPALRSTMERSFGHDFGAVRVHADPAAARRQDAAAYTVGQHIVVGTAHAAPQTAPGRWLYGHELAHVVQQSRAGAEPAVQRIGPGEWLARLFGGGTFDTAELKAYLAFLDQHGEIEDHRTSDNKAREIIRRWRAGDPDFPEPTLPQKQLMLLEMIDGPTLDDDEHAILELLRGSPEEHVRALLATAGGEEKLAEEFHGDEADELAAFLADWHTDRSNRPIAGSEIGTGRGKVTISEITVNQDTPQTVTIRYRDGRMEAFRCSTGKGTCVVPPRGRGPTRAQLNQRDSNWTPNGDHKVKFKLPVNPTSNIRWWTQFHDRDIALHEYEPVDGTPLSHGCVRLDAPVAKRIYDGAVRNHTNVHVVGTPRPRITHDALVTEWEHDFDQGDGPVRDGGDRALRRHLRLAFGGVGDAELDRRIDARVIPECGGTP